MPFLPPQFQFSLEHFSSPFGETFGELLIVLSKNANLLYLLFLMAMKCYILRLIMQNFFTEHFSKNSYLNDSGISLPAFSSKANLKMHHIPLTP